MTAQMFTRQMLDCDTMIILPRPVVSVVIRTADGDREVAAVHRDGTTLVIDLGEEACVGEPLTQERRRDDDDISTG